MLFEWEIKCFDNEWMPAVEVCMTLSLIKAEFERLLDCIHRGTARNLKIQSLDGAILVDIPKMVS